MIPQDTIDRLRQCMPDLLQIKLRLDRVEKPFRCPSPDHEDRNPSASYHGPTNTVHCFGCGKSWDVFDLIGMLDGIDSFADQARAVAVYVGYPLGDQDLGHKKHNSPKNRNTRFPLPKPVGGPNVYDACFDAFVNLFEPVGQPGLDYLRSRGFNEGDALRYGFGFTQDPSSIMPSFRCCEPDAFGYITIPYFDRDCRTASYVVLRTVCRGDPNRKEWRPKDLASPLWREWMLSASLPLVCVTEGIFDAIAFERLTGRPTMALGGTSMATRLLSVLERTPTPSRPKAILICPDQDDAGLKAAEHMADGLNALGVPNALAPAYPDGAKDANDWLMAEMTKATD